MMDEPRTETQVFCDRATFLALREDPAFHWILTLGRIVNSIRFVEAAIVERGGANAAAAARQTSSAILYLAALLSEALKFAARLGQHFRDFEAYRAGFVPLLNDAAVRELRDGILHRLRTQSVFHHDDKVILAGLELMDGEDYVLFSASSRLVRDSFYDLPDIAVMHFALARPRSVEEFEEQNTRAFHDIADLGQRFARCADELIREYASRTGWRRRSVTLDDPNDA